MFSASTGATPLPSRVVLTPHLAGAVTGVGSLPYTDAEEAVSAVEQYCQEIPFWPQLPQVSDQEGIIGQGLTILGDLVVPRASGYGYEVRPGCLDAVIEALHGSTGALASQGFSAFHRVLHDGHFQSASVIKGQIEGPITLATYLFYRGRPFIADAALFSAVAFHIAQLVCWQIQQLRITGKPIMLFIDEPALCLEDSVAGGIPLEHRLSALSAILRDVRARGAVAGLHCCAARPFARMLAAKPDILSFDAHRELEPFLTYRETARFVENGGWVAYGMIPNSAELHSVQPTSLFNRWLIAASMASDPQMLAQRSLITATCGLGLLSREDTVRSFELAAGVGALIRRLAGR